MKILVCGAQGFIGAALCQELRQQGHEVSMGLRQPFAANQLACDFSQTLSCVEWQQRLMELGVPDLLINAIGSHLNASETQLRQVHYHAPLAMFKGAARAGVRACVQISALGQAELSTFIASKQALDVELLKLPMTSLVLRPSLVVAEAGLSSRALRQLALLPRLFVPQAAGPIQPVSLSDVCALVSNFVCQLDQAEFKLASQVIVAAGPEVLSFHAMQARYRSVLGLPPAPVWTVPASLMTGLAYVASLNPASLLTPASWRLLRAGNQAKLAEQQQMQRLLGRRARPFEYDMQAYPSHLLRAHALTQWMRASAIAVLSFIWLSTAWISALVFPIQQSYALLAMAGVPASWQATLLSSACALDLSLGLACYIMPGRRLWLAQMGLILGYSGFIALALPEFYRHPFAPIIKNIAILSLLAYLYLSEEPSLPDKS